jgi:hypothetical protein
MSASSNVNFGYPPNDSELSTPVDPAARSLLSIPSSHFQTIRHALSISKITLPSYIIPLISEVSAVLNTQMPSLTITDVSRWLTSTEASFYQSKADLHKYYNGFTTLLVNDIDASKNLSVEDVIIAGLYSGDANTTAAATTFEKTNNEMLKKYPNSQVSKGSITSEVLLSQSGLLSHLDEVFTQLNPRTELNPASNPVSHPFLALQPTLSIAGVGFPTVRVDGPPAANGEYRWTSSDTFQMYIAGADGDQILIGFENLKSFSGLIDYNGETIRAAGSIRFVNIAAVTEFYYTLGVGWFNTNLSGLNILRNGVYEIAPAGMQMQDLVRTCVSEFPLSTDWSKIASIILGSQSVLTNFGLTMRNQWQKITNVAYQPDHQDWVTGHAIFLADPNLAAITAMQGRAIYNVWYRLLRSAILSALSQR